MFGEKEYALLVQSLEAAGDEAFRRFNESLMPGTTDICGVRMPELRRIAKTILPSAEEYLALARDDTHEERLLKGACHCRHEMR